MRLLLVMSIPTILLYCLGLGTIQEAQGLPKPVSPTPQGPARVTQRFRAAMSDMLSNAWDDDNDDLDDDTTRDTYTLTSQQHPMAAAVHMPNRPLLNDTSMLADMRVMGQLASIPYCGNATAIRDFTCGIRCASPLLKGIKVTHVIESDRNLAYVAVKDENRQIIVTFRGSQLDNWFDNFEAYRIRWPFELAPRFSSLSTTSIHKGFVDGYQSIRSRVRAAIQSHLDSPIRSNYTLYLNGHSLGGSLSTLVAVDLITSGLIPARRLHMYSLGAPRVGNRDWAKIVSSQVLVPSQSHRITVDEDVFPHTPTRQMGFAHQVWEIYILGADKVYVCNEFEDKECSRSRKPFLSASAHRRWFGVENFFGKRGCSPASS